MHKYKCSGLGSVLKIILFFVIILMANNQAKAQSVSNLEIFYQLADSSVNKLVGILSEDCKKVYFKPALLNDYLIFQSKIISGIQKNDKEILTTGDSAITSVIYTIDDAKVKYSDVYKEGIFGDYKVKREIKFNGNYLISENGTVKNSEGFAFINTDIVDYDDIQEIENPSIPFTKGEVPAEPFFSSLVEPVVAIGSAAVAVILFFTVRSK